MNRPFVLHTRVVTGDGGGPEKTILNSPRFLADLGFDSACAYMHPPDDGSGGKLKQRAEKLGAEFLSIPDKGPLDLSVPWKLSRLCSQRKVAIWHGHDYKSNALGILARRFWKMKLVATMHGFGFLPHDKPVYGAIDHWALRHVDHVVCVSDDLQQRAQHIGVRTANCRVIYNSIDLEQYNRGYSQSDAKQQFGVNDGEFLLGAVGRLVPEKGFELLLQAFRQLNSRFPKLRLVIAGDGPLNGDLRALARKLGCENSVIFAGHLADPRILYQALDGYVLSSLTEAFPNVLLEAMAFSVPVVATRVGAVANILQDGDSGIIVEPHSVEQLVCGIDRLLSEHCGAALGSKGYQRVTDTFQFSQRMSRMAALYEELLGDDNRPNGNY